MKKFNNLSSWVLRYSAASLGLVTTLQFTVKPWTMSFNCMCSNLHTNFPPNLLQFNWPAQFKALLFKALKLGICICGGPALVIHRFWLWEVGTSNPCILALSVGWGQDFPINTMSFRQPISLCNHLFIISFLFIWVKIISNAYLVDFLYSIQAYLLSKLHRWCDFYKFKANPQPIKGLPMALNSRLTFMV